MVDKLKLVSWLEKHTSNLISLLSLVISFFALYFSFFTYERPYIEAEERVLLHEIWANASINTNLEFCKTNKKLCPITIPQANAALEAFRKIVDSEREKLKPEAYGKIHISIMRLKNDIIIESL